MNRSMPAGQPTPPNGAAASNSVGPTALTEPTVLFTNRQAGPGAPASNSARHDPSQSDKVFPELNGLRQTGDKELGVVLCSAIAHRVDTTLEAASFNTAANLTAVTPPWKSEDAKTNQRPKAKRGKMVGFSLAAIIGVITPVFALTRPTLFADSKPKTAKVVQVSSQDADVYPVKLAAHDPEYRVSQFFRMPFQGVKRQNTGLHLWNGSVFIDVRPELPELGQIVGVSTNPNSTPVTIGGAPGQLLTDKDQGHTRIRWTVDGQAVVGYAGDLGAAQVEVLAALGQIRFADKKLNFVIGPSKFSAVTLEEDTNQYNATLVGVKNHLESISYSVALPPEYADDYLANQKAIRRGTRTYYLDPPHGKHRVASFRFGPATVFVFASVEITQERLLAFADTITEATPEEWAEMVKRDMSNGPLAEVTPSKNVLADGLLDEENRSSANFEFFVAEPAEQKKDDCEKVVFSVKDQSKTSCIAKNSTEQFRLLETFTADGVTVVYGVDAPDDRDNHVVRVTDAAGDVVAEDVTVDQRQFTGRAFVLPLPTDSVAPFTVELFDFDREWYLAGDVQPETYIHPGSKPLATATLKP